MIANRFLEHRKSHTDINTSSKLAATGDVLESFDNPFLEHRTSHAVRPPPGGVFRRQSQPFNSLTNKTLSLDTWTNKVLLPET